MQIQPQEMDQWCWAAVSVSVDKFFNPSTLLTQCSVAEKVLQRSCCLSRGACNEPAKLQVALSHVDRLREVKPHPLLFSKIRAEIDSSRPVCVRIGWNGGGGHFVIIDWYGVLASGEELLHVLDPLFPNSTVFYQEFVSAYQGDGQWTGTFLVK